MSTVAVQPFWGIYRVQPVPSTFAFAVRHSGVFSYRGSFSDVTATLRGDGDALELEGSARVESISVVEPPAMRASLLGPEFFDAERHPELVYESDSFRRDGDEVVVDGRLTIKGETRPVEARGALVGPLEDPMGNTKLGLELKAVVDRTEFGLKWQAPMPKGGVALGHEVTLNVDLELLKA